MRHFVAVPEQAALLLARVTIAQPIPSFKRYFRKIVCSCWLSGLVPTTVVYAWGCSRGLQDNLRHAL